MQVSHGQGQGSTCLGLAARDERLHVRGKRVAMRRLHGQHGKQLLAWGTNCKGQILNTVGEGTRQSSGCTCKRYKMVLL